MRPKLLEIEGLQSFTDVQRIDFETLGETGIFGIFGPTGSGKSTILDAITFALYGKVKRAEGGTQGIINSSRNTARVSFSFELVRDGKRTVYRVERTYQRRKNSQNACEPKVARLIEVTEAGDIPLCDKAMEVSYYIKDLLGLSSEDFTRAVVLPQNSFQEFLLLNNSDRRGMLERIFYLEEYGKQLLDKLGSKMAGLKSRLDIMSGELMGYADASDDALETAQKASETALAERSRIEKELKQSELRFNEAREVWGLVRDLDGFNRKETELAASKELFAAKRVQLDKAVKAVGLLESIRTNMDLSDKLNETKKQLGEVTAALPGFSDGLDEMRQKVESLKKEAAAEQPRLVGLRTRLVDALGIKSELSNISGKLDEINTVLTGLNTAIAEKNAILQNEISFFDKLAQELDKLTHEMEPLKIDPEYRQHIQDGAKLENDVSVLQGNVKELEEKRALLKSSGEGLEHKLEEIKETIGTVQKILNEGLAESQKHADSKPGDRNSILKSIERIHSVQGLHNILKLRKDELDQMKTRLRLQQENISKMAQKVLSLEQAMNIAGEINGQCRLELENAINEMDKNSAYILSKHLTEGEPCPVCGSTQHPLPAVHTGEIDMTGIEQKAEAAKGKLADAEKTFKAAEREAITAGEQMKTLVQQNVQMAKDLEVKTAEFEAEKQKLPEKLRILELEQVQEEVEKANKAYAEKLETIDAWEIRQGEYRDSLQKLNNTLAEHRLVENGIVTERKLNHESAEQLEHSLSDAVKAFNAVNEIYTAFLQKYSIENANGELKRFADNDRKLHVLQKELEQTRESADNKKAQLEKLREELQLQKTDQIKLEADAGGLRGQCLEREMKLKEMAGEADIETEIKRIDAKLEEYPKLEGEFLQTLQSMEKQYNEYVTRKTLLENQQDIYAGNLKTGELQLKSALAEKGFADAAEVQGSVLPADTQAELKAGINEYDQSLSNIHAQKQLLQQKLKSRTITEEEWNRINIFHTELSAHKQESVSRSEVARSSYEILKVKHDKWVGLSKEYSELSHKQGLFEQIQKILKAEHRKDNSFIDYIAEERLRYVAAKASETIGVMTKFRYELQLDVEAGFIIRDNANGGAHRMVTSLSGGETFLTSLSLALALSEQIQLKGQSPLEFFFLDEGFGTLDADLLDTVIDALERLSSRERVIGLISHVPELKSRIGRRLIVEPPTLQNGGSRVIIEKA
jgi:DNA repair protein SbcC/Rad50